MVKLLIFILAPFVYGAGYIKGYFDILYRHLRKEYYKGKNPKRQSNCFFKYCETEDGRKLLYIDHSDFYCDLEEDKPGGTWSVFFRDLNTHKEAYKVNDGT